MWDVDSLMFFSLSVLKINFLNDDFFKNHRFKFFQNLLGQYKY